MNEPVSIIKKKKSWGRLKINDLVRSSAANCANISALDVILNHKDSAILYML